MTAHLKVLSKSYRIQCCTKDIHYTWYSSPTLFKILINCKTNAVGTVRSNRKYMPKDFITTKLKRGEYRMRSCNGILALKWEDKRDVHIFSTKHEKVEMTEQCKNQFNPTLKPKYVIEYNKVMIGIDRQDQMLACFSVMRKYMKYTQHCLTFMIGRERVHSVRYHVG